VVVTMPRSMMAHLAVVPPMSKEMSRSSPRLRARLAQPIAPAAGPDSIVCTGFTRAVPTEHAPPLDWVIRSWPRKPRAASRCSNVLR